MEYQEGFSVLVNRSKKKLEFLWDGKVHVFKPGEKRVVQNEIAYKGIREHNIVVDPFNLEVKESFFGIEGSDEFPCNSTDLDPDEVKEQEKIEGSDTVIVDGQIVKKKLLDLRKKRYS